MEQNKAGGFSSVDAYLATITDSKQKALLERVRTIIKKAAPEAEETISYQMPAYKYHGMLVYFAAWKNHWGLYPASAAIKETFKEELAAYKQTKGAIQFPWGEPLPEGLITRLVKKRVEENLEAARLKTAKKANSKK
ncbi:iron chaperone [Parapedobacter sp. DT-150]|uniref:iron chaperone n=1 Tax=Parapedobacter sp. DT-150 TaxID=3396162 RepID=UPI003F194FE6